MMELRNSSAKSVKANLPLKVISKIISRVNIQMRSPSNALSADNASHERIFLRYIFEPILGNDLLNVKSAKKLLQSQVT
jgi:hypothetical protein